MSHVGHYSTLMHPRASEVHLTDHRPREIVIQLADGMDVELWPGADDHTEQVAWLERAEEALRTARQMMDDRDR
ncbi:hypothetical protein F4561_006545 [Lipingzhangella halophila]|uniref:Uncharacterized protein n=1 Tax=Lipingzhangella halophila TaxID=1783352 RepID=A0A7W7RQD0_9ACTN|nr:hypothetical protein [Lipingzhangella halophila]MBB4935636.1 hypothetical protein [Lipingzhangella halophila]